MAMPDWRTLELGVGVLREPALDDRRLILWLPRAIVGACRHWQRVSSVPGSLVMIEPGIYTSTATSISATQTTRGGIGKLLQRFRKSRGRRTWTLPSGEPAEQRGEPETDLILVWADDTAIPLDEARIKARWPEAKRFERVAKGLFLISGIEPAGDASEIPPAEGSAHDQAEQLLAAARQVGDRSREASALTDLGIACFRRRDARRAASLLEEALGIARTLGDRSMETDVLGNLGLALLDLGEHSRAIDFLDQALALTRASGERIAEKIALANLGRAYSKLRDPARAASFYTQALGLARQVGDREHEADLLWYLAIEAAEQGRRDHAATLAEAAIAILEQMGKPQATTLSSHLKTYRLDDTGAPLDRGGALPEVNLDSSFGVSVGTSEPGTSSAPKQATRGPRLLRMAMSGAKSMAKFVGSGCQTVPEAIHGARLRTCATCEHHAGIRCKVCGCFTNVKTRLPHEECPLGKWPAELQSRGP